MSTSRYQAYMGLAPKRIPHWEHWSCPDAETYLTGIDFYEHPRQCRERMRALYPQLELEVPTTDAPIPRPELDQNTTQMHDEHGLRHVRWGTSITSHWDWGVMFKSAEDVFAFSPLKQGDFTGLPITEARDYRDESRLYAEYRRQFPAEWGDRAPEGSDVHVYFYNTMFMWPLLTFGWELFLETCLDPRFERIMDEFAEINRRVFRVFARLPVNFVISHDDIVMSRGPVCSPQWMSKYIYPRYEEFWGMVRAAGKEVIFQADGCLDQVADNVIACGARGLNTEPHTDFKALARRHAAKNLCLSGEGDNRVLMRNRPEEIRAMVQRMVETARITGGYMMCVGNHIPWNVPPQAIKHYLDLSTELAHR